MCHQRTCNRLNLRRTRGAFTAPGTFGAAIGCASAPTLNLGATTLRLVSAAADPLVFGVQGGSLHLQALVNAGCACRYRLQVDVSVQNLKIGNKKI